ncbi:hypothetical protein LV89_04697 [Arcicella aurantiaca]|uniref:Uncharacterized protein n=1 Tax=Arcicella aurantiaca TaxID=591202 RepID=A0A316DFX0_9BACT|nr:hypothetical protein [Arcicella aurantiaca]PWK16815.1 hypothetical protein LV89_04697 [Arcicella aurantiaca]
MKTSNKLLIALGIGLILSVVSYAFVLRGAYQNAVKHPIAAEIRVPLKSVQYLNLTYNREVTFKYGSKFEIEIDRSLADSLILNYKNDTLNLDVRKIGFVTIISPNLPITKFIDNSDLDNNREVMTYGDNNGKTINIDSSFVSGSFVATFPKNGILRFYKCQLDKIDVKGKENLLVDIEKSNVKQLNLGLTKFSSLTINHSQIQSKNVVLGDSCNLSLLGKDTRTIFLK